MRIRLKPDRADVRAGHTNITWVRRVVGAGLALVVLAFGAQTLLRNAVWADPVALWQEAVDLAPAHYRPRLLLGEALQDAGRRDEALEQYRTAIRLRPVGSDRLREGGAGASPRSGSGRRLGNSFSRRSPSMPRNVPAQNALAVLDALETRLGVDGNRR